MPTEEKSYCRICSGLCGVTLTVENQRITGIRGDKTDPRSRGYACIKGLQAVEAHYGEDRLLHPQKRLEDGSFVSIPLEQALDEIAARLKTIIDREGPDAVAAYRGTIGYFNASANRMMRDWLRSIGSNSFYTSMTIDQSAKYVTAGRLGHWAGGSQSLDESDVWLLAGNNPLVSVSAAQMMCNPTLTLRDAKARGFKLIVIDPRHTETAKLADVFLQIIPGEDVTVAAGLLNVILTEEWEDKDFCGRFAEGLDVLRQAVSPFTPDFVERRAGVPGATLRQAAELFARIGTRGTANASTGPSMAPRSNLADHLYNCLNVVCGRYPRAGERVSNPGVLSRSSWVEMVVPPRRPWESGPKSHVRPDIGILFGERMCGLLADEILTPGAGQIKSLFVVGGNPVSAFPDQNKILRAVKALDLLVSIEPVMTATAWLSHYILPPRAFYEQATIGPIDSEISFYPKPLAAFAPAVVPPPEGSEVVYDWYVFWALAKRLGITLTFSGTPLDMENAPDDEEIQALLVRKGPVPFEEIKRNRGQLLDLVPVYVRPKPDAAGRFQVAPSDIAAELAEVAQESGSNPEGYTHRLSSRRIRYVSNTMYQNFPAIRRHVTYNAAHLHPDDIAKLGFQPGERAVIVSEHGRIPAILEEDDTVRPGVVSMAHGWGGIPGDNGPYEEVGSNTNLLVSTDRYLEPINAMPRMSAIPVRIERPRENQT